MHPIVGCGNGFQLVVTQAVDLQLEGQTGLQVPVDPVLVELGIQRRGL